MSTTKNIAKRLVAFLVAVLALVVIIAGQAPLGFWGALLLGVLLGIALDYTLYGGVVWAASPGDLLFGAVLAALVFLVVFLWQPVWFRSILGNLLKEPAFLGFAFTVILLGRPRRLWPSKGVPK